MAKTQIQTGEPTLEDARAAFLEVKGRWRGLAADEAALLAANSWHHASETERASERFAYTRRQLERAYPDGRYPPSHRIPSLLFDVREKIERLQPFWLEANERWRVACEEETNRVAKTMQARQKALVKQMAKSVEELSAAMAAERALHDDLARTTPIGRSIFLPEASPRIEGLDDWHGELFAWRRRVHELGILDSIRTA